jgi:hypothetical protein
MITNKHPFYLNYFFYLFKGRDDFLHYRLTSYGNVLCDDMGLKKQSGDQTVSTSKAKQILEMLKGNSSGTKKRVRRKINVSCRIQI